MENDTVVKIAHGSSEIAKAIIEMAKDGYYPVEYRLPIITFSKDGERAYLPPSLEILVEGKILKLQNAPDEIYTTLKGLIDLYRGKTSYPKGREVSIALDELGNIKEIVIIKNVDVSNYPILSLYSIIEIMRNEKVTNNINFKKLKLDTILRIRKLKRDF